MKKKIFPAITAVIGGIGTAAIGIIMNAVLIPRIEADTNGIRCFDMNFGYTPDTARRFLDLIGEDGRFIYLNRQLPLDFVYPVFYTLLFVSLICLLYRKRKKLAALLAPAILLAVCDYAENIMSIIMLKNGIPSDSFARIASAVTAGKTVLMYFTIALVIALLIGFIIGRKGENKNGNS